MIQQFFSWMIVFTCTITCSFGMELNVIFEPQEDTPLNRQITITFCLIETLPDDPFWKIMFDNDNPLTQTEIYNLSCTSKSIQKRFGMLIPKVILSKFPTVFQYLRALSAIEQAENKYHNLFKKYPSQMFYLKGYPQEIKRLLEAEPYMHLSPWFRWNLGSQRISALAFIHNINVPADDREWSEKMRCGISAITRDPLVSAGLSLTTVGVMALLGWEINKNKMIYNQNYLKYLNYTTTQQFVDDQMASGCSDCEYYYNPAYPSCFQDYSFNAPSLTCWNPAAICAGGRVNNSLLNDTLSMTIQTLLTTIGNLNKTWGSSLPPLSYQDINSTITPNFIPYCTQGYAHDSFLGRLRSSHLLMENYIQTFGYSSTNESNCEWVPWKGQQLGMWQINLHHYSPDCIATAMTPQAGLDGLIATVSFLQFTLVVMFFIGWSVTF